MKFIKKYLKVFIGVVGLIIVIVVLFSAMHESKLEAGTLKNWAGASDNNRLATVKLLTASDENSDLIVACVTKMAQLEKSMEFAVSDAVRLCNLGIQLKENN